MSILVDNPRKMDLQLFAEGGAAPTDGAATPTIEGAVSPAGDSGQAGGTGQAASQGQRSPDVLSALLNGADPATLFGAPAPAIPQPAPVAEPTPAPTTEPAPAVPEPQLILGKFKTVDEVAKAYQEAQKLIGDQGNKLGQIERQLRELTTQPPEQQSQQQQPQQQSSQQPPEQQLTKEQLTEQYYEDPVGFMDKILEQRLGTAIKNALAPLAPVVEKHNQDQEVARFSEQISKFTADGQHSDFASLEPQMAQILEQYGDGLTSLPNAVEIIYNMAKGISASQTPPPAAPPTIEELLATPEARQKILADPSIKTEILKSHAEEIKQGAPPVVIGSQPGGVPPATPPERPRSVREASSMVSKFFKGQT